MGLLTLFAVVFWAHRGAVVSEAGASKNQLNADLEALVNGGLHPDEVPALAAWVVQDPRFDLSARLKVLGASVDAKLRHRVRLPALAEEDPHALMALVLYADLARELQAVCPDLPPEIHLICDPSEWETFQESVGSAMLTIMSEPPEFAAAARVGGNDLALQAVDALCGMGERGAQLARHQLSNASSERSAAFAVMALGCAGDREVDPEELRALVKQTHSPAASVVARLECAVQESCDFEESVVESLTPLDALKAFSNQLQGHPR